MPTAQRLHLSARDRHILELAAGQVTRPGDFGAALTALEEAVRLVIPAGRIFHLGDADEGPVVGSMISGVGITWVRTQVMIVRRSSRGGFSDLVPFARLARLAR